MEHSINDDSDEEIKDEMEEPFNFNEVTEFNEVIKRWKVDQGNEQAFKEALESIDKIQE